jgi:hypothetical protein
VLENKQSRETTDSAHLIIQWLTTSDAKRFVSLGETFASFFAVLGFVDAGNETKGESLILRSGAERRVSKEIQRAPPGPPFETRLRRSSGRGL